MTDKQREDWIEEKAERFMLQCPGGLLHSWASVKGYIKTFIRDLLEEQVAEDWIQGEPYEASISKPNEENLLPKNELMEEFQRIFARWGGLVGKEKQAFEQLKQLIEAQAEPSDIVRADVYKYILGVYDMLDTESLTLHEIVDLLAERILQIRKKEPSEAEVEEFVEKWTHIIETHNDLWSIGNRVKEMLKEYRELLRRG